MLDSHMDAAAMARYYKDATSLQPTFVADLTNKNWADTPMDLGDKTDAKKPRFSLDQTAASPLLHDRFLASRTTAHPNEVEANVLLTFKSSLQKQHECNPEWCASVVLDWFLQVVAAKRACSEDAIDPQVYARTADDDVDLYSRLAKHLTGVRGRIQWHGDNLEPDAPGTQAILLLMDWLKRCAGITFVCYKDWMENGYSKSVVQAPEPSVSAATLKAAGGEWDTVKAAALLKDAPSYLKTPMLESSWQHKSTLPQELVQRNGVLLVVLPLGINPDDGDKPTRKMTMPYTSDSKNTDLIINYNSIKYTHRVDAATGKVELDKTTNEPIMTTGYKELAAILDGGLFSELRPEVDLVMHPLFEKPWVTKASDGVTVLGTCALRHMIKKHAEACILANTPTLGNPCLKHVLYPVVPGGNLRAFEVLASQVSRARAVEDAYGALLLTEGSAQKQQKPEELGTARAADKTPQGESGAQA